VSRYRIEQFGYAYVLAALGIRKAVKILIQECT
jgi:hypothetical protein